jgi:tetratricopeptide (TPR) repeat protein
MFFENQNQPTPSAASPIKSITAKLHKSTRFFALATLLACTQEAPVTQWQQPPPIQDRAISVRISPEMSNPPPELRWREEILGLSTAIVQTSLADLSDVTCHVGSQPPPRFLDPERLNVNVRLSLDGGQDTFVLLATVCPADAQCRDLHTTGRREDPFDPMARLLSQIAARIGREIPPDALEASLRASLSKNDYARLLTGRAAAVLYGIMPAVPPDAIGDKRKDPIARAVFLDPDQALAQWILGRRELALGKRESAVTAFETAERLVPRRTVFAHDLASSLEGLDWRRAEEVYAQLARNTPDHRFTIARANALIALGRVDEAKQTISTLPERYAKIPDLLQMSVMIAEARRDTGPQFEELLATWQEAARDRPEPVRRRIAWLVERGDFKKALSLTPELAKRGATEESVRMRMSLALAAGEWPAAKEAARTLGLGEIEARIGARERLEKGDDPIDVVAYAKDRTGKLVRGELALIEGRIVGALEDADALLRIAPYDTEALSLRVRALQRAPHLGDLADASAALYYADPASARRLGIARPAKKWVPPHLVIERAARSIAVATATSANSIR